MTGREQETELARTQDGAGEEDHDLGASPDARNPSASKTPREIGGRDGPDPTRFGDWEKNGRCIDF